MHQFLLLFTAKSVILGTVTLFFRVLTTAERSRVPSRKRKFNFIGGKMSKMKQVLDNIADLTCNETLHCMK